MSENEHAEEAIVDSAETNEVEEAQVEESTEEQVEESQERSPESSEDKLARLKRQTKRLEKQLGVEDEKPAKKEHKTQSNELDYGQLAYLETKGVPEEDHDFILEEMQDSGRELKDVLGKKYIQEELKERQESRATQVATPKKGSRTAPNSKNSVEYWSKRPFADVPQNMREEVLNAKLEKERSAFNKA